MSGPSSGSGGVHVDSCGSSGRTVLAKIDLELVYDVNVGGGFVTLNGRHSIGETAYYSLLRVPHCGGALVAVDGTDVIGNHATNASGTYYQHRGQQSIDGTIRLLDPSGVSSDVGSDPFAKGYYPSDAPRAFALAQGALYGVREDYGSVFQADASGNVTQLGSVGPLTSVSTLVVTPQGGLQFIASNGPPMGSLFTVSPSGELTQGPPLPVPYDLVAVGDGFVASYASHDPTLPGWGTVVHIASDGSMVTLADNQFQPTGLAVVRDHVIWEADGVARAVPIGGGDVSDLDGVAFGLSSADAPKFILTETMAVDDDAIYRIAKDGLVRVPLPF